MNSFRQANELYFYVYSTKCSINSTCNSPFKKPNTAPTVINIHSSCLNAGRSTPQILPGKFCILFTSVFFYIHSIFGIFSICFKATGSRLTIFPVMAIFMVLYFSDPTANTTTGFNTRFAHLPYVVRFVVSC